MTFDKDTLRTFNNYLSKIAILIAPGMAIVEMVFHKGLLSGNIHDFPELILLLVWSLILSAPYYFLTTLTLLWFVRPVEKLGTELSSEDSDDYEEALPLTLLLAITTLGLYKVMMWLDWPKASTYVGIRREHIFCVLSVGLTMLISLPLAAIYYRTLHALIVAMVSQKMKAKKR